ncbi:MAG: NADH-quinone oxidoreductase subunit J [Candidatus Coatesbacteria bacterium]
MPAEAAFAVFALMALAGGFLAVVVRNVFRAALGLMLSLFGVAGLFLLQRAEFLAVVQVLVYVGGVSVLIIFAIMLTEREGSVLRVTLNRGLVMPGIVLGTVLALATAWAVVRAPFVDPPPAAVSARDLGGSLLNQFLVPFEAVSLLLLVALVGGLVIARDDPRDSSGSGRPEDGSC